MVTSEPHKITLYMAKIGTIKFDFQGEKRQVNVNCKSTGEFSANIPDEVAKALDLRTTLKGWTLPEVENKFHDALRRYKDASVTHELLIGIEYGSVGLFNCDIHGVTLHSERNSPYHLDISFRDYNRGSGIVLFGFTVVIKETTDGVGKYYKAVKGKEFPHWDKEQQDQPEKYFKRGDFHDRDSFTFIPFSEIAVQSLQNALEKLRSASEFLFRFIEQKPAEIESQLTKTKLLN